MTNQEYDEIQERLSKKLIKKPSGYLTSKEEEYNRGILAAKSIVKDIYCHSDIIHMYRTK